MDILQNLGGTAQLAEKGEDITTPPPAIIRPFQIGDLKIVRYLIGSSIMEPSSSANQSSLWTPSSLILWALITHLLITYFGTGWPTWLYIFSSQKYILSNWPYEAVQVLKILPAIVAPPVVLLALFELKHRNLFEESMTRAIGEEDLVDVVGYYSTKDSSSISTEKKKGSKEVAGGGEGGRRGFFVLEFDNRIIGAFGIDGRKPGKVLDSIVGQPILDSKKVDSPDSTIETTTPKAPESPYPLRNRSAKSEPSTPNPSSTSTSTYAPSSKSSYTDYVHLRRFSTSISFRPAGIDADLINYATAFAFSTSSPSSLPPAKKLIYSLRPSIESDLLKKLIAVGFKQVENGSEMIYEPESWKVEKKGLVEGLIKFLWPVSLEWKTYALTREDWSALNK